MASGKRQPSKQKRTNQNRQERAARQARASAAAAAASASSSGASSSGGSSPARGSLLGRLRGGSGASSSASSPTPSPTAPSGGSAGGSSPAPAARGAGAQPVGYRAALTALLAAIAAVIASFFLQQPVDAEGDIYTRPAIVAEWSVTALRAAEAAPTADAKAIVDAIGDDWMPNRESERMFVAALPWSLGAVLPVLASYLLFRAVQQRRGSKVVNRAMYATLLGAFISYSLMTYFLPTVIAAWVAGFQVRRADRAELLAAQAEAAGAEGDVIEAEVVDDAEVVDEGDPEADDHRG